MKRKRKTSHIHTYFIAVVLKGIAAIFYSTGFYVLTHNFTNNNGTHAYAVARFVKPCVFLFGHKADKPYDGLPRCRSPPIFNQFSRIPKN